SALAGAPPGRDGALEQQLLEAAGERVREAIRDRLLDPMRENLADAVRTRIRDTLRRQLVDEVRAALVEGLDGAEGFDFERVQTRLSESVASALQGRAIEAVRERIV